MKVTVEQEIDLPDVEVYKTVLEAYYDKEKDAPDGWKVFDSFEEFIRIKYRMAIDDKKLGKRI